MKAILISLSLVFVAAAAYAQGKVCLANDVNSPITMGGYLYPQDAALAGKAVPTTGPLPSGVSLRVGLYGGTSYGFMSLQGSTIINPPGGTGYDAGTIAPTKIILTGIPGGTPAYFQVRVWDSAYADFNASGNSYCGVGSTFTMIPGSSIAYPNTYNGGNTTWVAGPIIIGGIPEPNIVTLTGLGAAVLLISRRRSQMRT